MNIESNYVFAIATISDWLKRIAPVFQPMRSKTNRTMYASYRWLLAIEIGPSRRLLLLWIGSLRSYDGNCKENVLVKLNFALS